MSTLNDSGAGAFRAPIFAIAAILGMWTAGASAANLTVADSLNRYSLYGRLLISMGDGANTAAGGWVGSDSSIIVKGNNSLRSTVTSGDSIYMDNGGPDTVWGRTIVGRYLYAKYNDHFDSTVYVGDSAFLGHSDSLASLRMGRTWGGQFRMDEWGYDTFANVSQRGANASNSAPKSLFTSSDVVAGVTWNANPPKPYVAFDFPDTSLASGSINIVATANEYQNATVTCAGARTNDVGSIISVASGAMAGVSSCVQDTFTDSGKTVIAAVLPPGNYGHLELTYGTNLYLGEGVYHFSKIVLACGSGRATRLLAIQPHGARTVIVTDSGLSTGSTAPTYPTVIAPLNYEKGYGTGTNQFAGGTMLIVSHATTTLANYLVLWATVTAPNDTVYAKETVKLFGQIFAKRIVADNHFKGTDGAFIPYYPTSPTITVSTFNATVAEPDTLAGGKPDTVLAKFVLSMNHVNGLPVTVWYHTVDSTAASTGTWSAQSGSPDYVAVKKDSVVIPATTLVDTISIKVMGDLLAENTEYFKVVLDSTRYGILGSNHSDSVGVGTILDNDLHTFSIDDIGPFVEADSTVRFTVTLNSASGVDIQVNYSTRPGTAASGVRYDSTWGTLTIPAGHTTATIAVKIHDDTIREPSPETFHMVLGGSNLAKASDSVGLATILDDGDLASVRVADAGSVVEGATAKFAVTAGPTKDTTWLYWHTVSGTAVAGVDFKAASGTIVLLPGQRLDTIRIATYTDSVWEPTETFFVRVDSVLRGKLVVPVDSLAKAWILDANGAPTVSFLSADTSVREDVSDSVPVVVGLSGYASVDVKVRVVAQAGTATAGADYTVFGLVVDTLTIPAGSLTATFKVHVVPDSLDEYDETAKWALVSTGAVAVGTKSSYTLTILDDDSAPSVRVVRDTQVLVEGNSVRVRFSLTAISGKDISAWYRTSGTATSGVDDDLVSGAHYKLNFPAGTDTASVVLQAYKDNLYEPTETVRFTLDSVVNASVLATHAVDTVSILDADGVPTVRFGTPDTTVSEGVGTVTLTLKLSHPSSVSETVGIKAIQGTAALDSLVKGSDAILDTTTVYRVSFAAGDTVATFGVKIIDDGRVESTESFSLKFVEVDSLALGASAAIHILDNDALPVVAITSPKDSLRTNVAQQTIAWTANGISQPSKDTLLIEGWNTVVRSYTDTAGNTGADTIHVHVDLTAPTVVITQLNGTKVSQPDTITHLVNTVKDTVYWSVTDNGTTTRHVLDTTLSEGIHTIVRTACDETGNCGSDTIRILVDTTAPKVTIVTPSNGDTLNSATAVVHWTWTDDPAGTAYDISGSKTDTTILGHYGWNTITRCATDSAGNKGCASVDVYLATPSVSKAYYLDANNDGKVDEAVVVFNSSWLNGTDTTLKLSFTLGGETRTGTIASVSGGKVVVKLDSAFSYGLTSTNSKDTGTFKITTTYETATGTTASSTASQSFSMGDSVAPVIVSATITRTESYSGQDALFITTSEPLDLSSGSDWLQIYRCTDGSATCDSTKMSWVTVPDSEVGVTSDGRYYILIDTVATGTVRPTYQIRFVDGVSDTLGNSSDTSKTRWVATVTGDARPTLVTVSVPGTIPYIDASERDRKGDGGFVLQASNGNSSTLQWWDAETGSYLSGSDSKVTSVCPQASVCNGPTLEINYPVKMTIYIYDHAGTYVISKTVDITREDLDALKKDKLDRVQVSIQWNHRSGQGQVVASGIYHWRIVSFLQLPGNSVPVMQNTLYKLGVKVAK
jgi:hypothetical protein